MTQQLRLIEEQVLIRGCSQIRSILAKFQMKCAFYTGWFESSLGRVLCKTTLRAEATFLLGELVCEKQPLQTTVQFSIVHARNSSRDSQARLIVRSVVKWCEVRGNTKIATTLICCTRCTQCSKPVKNRKETVFLIYSSRFLDGFERLTAEATFRTTAHTAKMQPLLLPG